MQVSSDPDLDTVWKLLTTTGSSPSNFGLTVAYVSMILLFMWVSSYASCEYHLTFHVSMILLFMWAPSYASQNRHLHHKQAIAPTIVWGLLTGLASSRRRRSAGALLKCCNWLQWRQSQCEHWSTKMYFLWVAQAWRRFLPPETSPAFSIPLTKVET